MYCRVCRVIYTRLHDGSQFLVSLGGKHSNLFRFLEFLKWSVHPSWITAVWTLLSNPNFLADFLWTCIRSFVIHPWLKFGAAAKNDNDPQMFLPMNKVQNKIAVILFPLPPQVPTKHWISVERKDGPPLFFGDKQFIVGNPSVEWSLLCEELLLERFVSRRICCTIHLGYLYEASSSLNTTS